MEFKKISTPSLKELFVQQVESMILSGRLEIGAKLPSERELAEGMQVSRAVVNAGINEMAAKGFLEIRPRIGAYVADYHRNGTAETLLSIMKYNGGRLRHDEIRSILELKDTLDRMAVSLLVPKITDGEVDTLRAHYQAMCAARDAEHVAEAVFGFHHDMAFYSGNTLLPMIYQSFKAPIMGLWERYCRKHGAETLCRNTGVLVDAIARRDADAALGSIRAAIDDAIRGTTQIYNE